MEHMYQEMKDKFFNNEENHNHNKISSIENFVETARKWFPQSLPQLVEEMVKSNGIRVMSYNVLANGLVGKTNYGNLNRNLLDWSKRRV